MIIASSEWRGGNFNFQQNSIALPHSFDFISHKSRECERILLVYMYLIFLKKLLTIFSIRIFFFIQYFHIFIFIIFSLEWITWVFSFNSVILSSRVKSSQVKKLKIRHDLYFSYYFISFNSIRLEYFFSF